MVIKAVYGKIKSIDNPEVIEVYAKIEEKKVYGSDEDNYEAKEEKVAKLGEVHTDIEVANLSGGNIMSAVNIVNYKTLDEYGIDTKEIIENYVKEKLNVNVLEELINTAKKIKNLL